MSSNIQISSKKPNYPLSQKLKEYLMAHDRYANIPVSYQDLLRWNNHLPLLDKDNQDTLWECVLYQESDWKEINAGLTKIYADLKAGGEVSVMEHLFVDRIDYCTFGNSNPFRIRIMNKFNDNYDYFYLKKVDASRIYGLELEHILSPNRMNYLVNNSTLIEEHIAGIPGDQFIKQYMPLPVFNKVRMAKEFVKFNERCFIRLLGDMRSYNFVVDVTPDFENEQYRIKAIDFDQQSFEGKAKIYRPQFFKENAAFVKLAMDLLSQETVKQYQHEERSLIIKRIHSSKLKFKEIIACMQQDTLSSEKNTQLMRDELNAHHNTNAFENCRNMGELLQMNLKLCLSDLSF